MRIIVNIMVAMCALALLGMLWTQKAREYHEVEQVQTTAASVRLIEQTIRAKATYDKKIQTNERGWPMTVSPSWFTEDLPRNALLSKEHPWIEVAPESQAGLRHPPVRLAVTTGLATFWYNPYQGVVRARVPVMISDAKSAAAYNQINGTSLVSILEPERPLESPIKLAAPSKDPNSPE